MTEIEPSKRCPTRFRTDNGVVIACSQHAVERAYDRKIDLEARFRSLAGKRLSEYKRHGVVATFYRGARVLKVITVW